jgi:hypothetical protein
MRTKHIKIVRSHQWRRKGRLAAILIALAIAAGCGDGRPLRVPVSGQVLIDGKPLRDAHIRFYPTEGRSATAMSDPEGRFALSCYQDNDGVIPGQQKVVVAAFETINANTLKWNAPKKYSEEGASGLEYKIEKPESDFKIELTWDGGKPFVEKLGVGKGGD